MNEPAQHASTCMCASHRVHSSRVRTAVETRCAIGMLMDYLGRMRYFQKTPRIGQCSLGKTWSSNQTTHANLIAANIAAALSPPCLCHVSMWSLCGRTVIPQPPFLLHRQIKESGGRNPLASDCSMSFLASGILFGKVSGLSGWSLDRILGTLPRFSTFYRIDLWIDNGW